MFRLDKKKIFCLYQYYLIGNKYLIPSFLSQIYDSKKIDILFDWFSYCLENEDYLIKTISSNLKKNWLFNRLMVIDRAILVYSSNELMINPPSVSNFIISQSVNFSKTYSTGESYKYINKVLDLISKLFKEKNE